MTTTHLTRPSTAAIVAGAAYAAMFVLAILANFFVVEALVIADDAAATTENIAAQESTFRLGALAFVAIAALDIVIAWALHVLLRGTGEARSLLAAWLRLAYSAILAVSAGFMLLAAEIAAGTETLPGLEDAQRESLTMIAMTGFDIVWQIGLAVFGLHLVAIASILLGSRVGPRVLGIVLGAAGIAYVADAALQLTFVEYESVGAVMLPIVAVLSMVAEFWFAGWLLVRAPRAVAALPGQEPARVAA